MESSGSHRSGLLTAGGILSIVIGASEATFGATYVGSTIAHIELLKVLPPSTFPGIIWWIGTGVSIFAVGIVAVLGGVSAMRRKIFGLSLAGAICALPSGLLGILAVIFVALGKREFGAVRG